MPRRLRIVVLCAAAVVLYPVLALLARRRRRREAQNFFVMPQLTRVGDLVAATPVFAAIKAARPSARITVLASRKVSGMLEADPRISLVYYEDYKADLFALARELHRRRFDAAFLLSGTPLSAALALLALVPVRSKLVRRPRPLAEFATDCLANYRHRYDKGTNLDAFYLGILRDAGISAAGGRKLFTTPAGEAKATALMEGLGERVGIVVSAGNAIKEWGDERFRALAQALIEQGHQVLFIAGPADGPRVRRIAEGLRAGAAIAEGFTLAELPSLLARVKLFISADTGPLHVAEAVGVPTLDIIGPVAPNELTPPTTRVVLPEGVEPTIFAFHRAGPPELSREAATKTRVGRVLTEALALLDER